MYITTTKGEPLYILTAVSTNDITPYIKVNTWAKCKEQLEQMTTEVNNDRLLVQLIHKSINEKYHKAEASVRCNRKGWGSDFFKYITIEPLYTEAE